MMARRIRLGMVGGGQGAFIGAVHRIAARLDDQYELVAGALSSDPVRAHNSAAELHIEPGRSYAGFEEMAEREAARPDGIEVVAIVTPNHMHFAPAKAFLDRDIHVICDKPLTHRLEDALTLASAVAHNGLVFALTHNYTGYPMVRQAREMVASCALGTIRVEFVTGLRCESVAAELTRFVAGRALDDNAQMLMRFSGGARGMLWSSQVAPGNENALRLRVYGEKAGLDWSQEQPNTLLFTPLGKPPQLIRRAGSGASAVAAHASRIPAGHPEGYLEAFAQIYRDVAEQISARREAREPDPASLMVPGIADGVRGMRFITAAVASSRANAAWTAIEP